MSSRRQTRATSSRTASLLTTKTASNPAARAATCAPTSGRPRAAVDQRHVAARQHARDQIVAHRRPVVAPDPEALELPGSGPEEVGEHRADPRPGRHDERPLVGLGVVHEAAPAQRAHEQVRAAALIPRQPVRPIPRAADDQAVPPGPLAARRRHREGMPFDALAADAHELAPGGSSGKRDDDDLVGDAEDLARGRAAHPATGGRRARRPPPAARARRRRRSPRPAR